MTYKEFDRTRLKLKSLDQRDHDLDISAIMPIQMPVHINNTIQKIGNAVAAAQKTGSSVIMIMGAHVIRSGVQNYLIDLMEKGFISCLAVNGAMLIHDYELALIGATTENVARYIANGEFGFWRETGKINDIITAGSKNGMGLGESVGKYIQSNDLPHAGKSIAAVAWKNKLLLTCHVGIGYDIIHQHPNMNPAAFAETSYRDFLRSTHMLENLEGGVVMNLGSAVMGPEIFLKGLSMARNAAQQEGRCVEGFTTLVTDLLDLPDNIRSAPDKKCPQYYFRPWKTMLDRTVTGNSKSYYYKGRHEDSIPMLWAAINKAAGE